jgi:hypothetical protein
MPQGQPFKPHFVQDGEGLGKDDGSIEGHKKV